MKNQKIIFLTLIFLTSNLFGHDPIDYINTYLPEDSLVRIIHNNEPHGTGWFGFDSSKRCACNYIQDAFADAADRIQQINELSAQEALNKFSDQSVDLSTIYRNRDITSAHATLFQDQLLADAESSLVFNVLHTLDKEFEKLLAAKKREHIARIKSALMTTLEKK